MADDPATVGDDQLTFGPTRPVCSVYDDTESSVDVSITASLQGIFVLSREALDEDSSRSENVLTCYRRNRFQVVGDVSLSAWPKSVSSTAEDKSFPIEKLSARLTAVESRDWTHVAILAAPSRDPAESVIPGGPAEIELAAANSRTPTNAGLQLSIPISWERLQFRSATANNGRKRRELRQRFRVETSIIATKGDGSEVCIATASSSLLTVRGRSPKNFESRNDYPLYFTSPITRTPGQDEAMAIESHHQDPFESVFLSQPPAVSFFQAEAQGSLSNGQVVYSPTMWDWIDLSAATGETFGHHVSDLGGEESSPPLNVEARGDQRPRPAAIGVESEYNTGISEWSPTNAPLLTANQNKDFTYEAGSTILPTETSSLVTEQPIISSQPRSLDTRVAGTQRDAPDDGTTTEADDISGQSPLDGRKRYTYIPVGVDGWQPPVEPVYWPHPWSHVYKPQPWGQQSQAARRENRYYSVLDR
ncbi:hypothetical protein NKR23_g4722 [Pleurostoma richardsiae]|uniref:NDT80 domain-containing protein n=1 Tax=Pleurostoma richardsiae TaxID=41990 RepID=A0AA38S4F7_9PEZI|nr:hypothetical protein NKR23_g4722 [Pleurostoma richardsiae]